jgi:hypothetical protein
MRRLRTLALLCIALLAGGCTAQRVASDAWLGEWTGPEGTFLRIAGGQGIYQVTVRDLDGPRTFAGEGIALGIEFRRDGMRELIRATDGPGTGMKWLTEKHDCLVIRPGEGFCRD